MAVTTYVVANPTKAAITVNSKTAPAGGLATLSFDDAALANGWTDLASFLAQGCAVVKAGTALSDAQHAAFLLTRARGI